MKGPRRLSGIPPALNADGIASGGGSGGGGGDDGDGGGGGRKAWAAADGQSSLPHAEIPAITSATETTKVIEQDTPMISDANGGTADSPPSLFRPRMQGHHLYEPGSGELSAKTNNVFDPDVLAQAYKEHMKVNYPSPLRLRPLLHLTILKPHHIRGNRSTK